MTDYERAKKEAEDADAWFVEAQEIAAEAKTGAAVVRERRDRALEWRIRVEDRPALSSDDDDIVRQTTQEARNSYQTSSPRGCVGSRVCG